jgi:hypothetical protein
VRNLILSGGVAHDYARTSPMLAVTLAQVGIDSEIHEDFAVVESEGLAGFDLITLNCVRWTCQQTPDWRDEWTFELSTRARQGLLQHLAAGRGILALHAATICFDDWPEFRDILGAWWEWGHSGHAPVQEHAVRVVDGGHPITRGLGDFSITDELYTGARLSETVRTLLTGTWNGVIEPLLWTRSWGAARVCYNALGHGVEAFGHPAMERLLQRGALWTVGELTE